MAVESVSLVAQAGEIFGIVGPNGAGKTTTVECIQGLRRADAGTVRVLGLDSRRQAKALRQRIGAQLQQAALPDRLKCDLSGGQRQRLFIALALVGRPEVVFLDELTAGLDPYARRDTWERIRAVRASGVTVVVVTHLFTHRVQGESMRDAGIREGDTLVVRRQSNAREGEIVVATIPDEATGEPRATVKRLPRSGRTCLLPENPAYEPIESDGITIIGKVMGLWRAPV